MLLQFMLSIFMAQGTNSGLASYSLKVSWLSKPMVQAISRVKLKIGIDQWN